VTLDKDFGERAVEQALGTVEFCAPSIAACARSAPAFERASVPSINSPYLRYFFVSFEEATRHAVECAYSILMHAAAIACISEDCTD
jgi:hypothetical protein